MFNDITNNKLSKRFNFGHLILIFISSCRHFVLCVVLVENHGSLEQWRPAATPTSAPSGPRSVAPFPLPLPTASQPRWSSDATTPQWQQCGHLRSQAVQQVPHGRQWRRDRGRATTPSPLAASSALKGVVFLQRSSRGQFCLVWSPIQCLRSPDAGKGISPFDKLTLFVAILPLNFQMNGFSHSHYSVPGMFFHHAHPCCSSPFDHAMVGSHGHNPGGGGNMSNVDPNSGYEDHYESASICYGSPAAFYKMANNSASKRGGNNYAGGRLAQRPHQRRTSGGLRGQQGNL